MKIATWNVNSIVARQTRLLAWLEKEQPDVVCLQELKCLEEKFPKELLKEAGYHAVVYGQRTYNGVAILAREPIENHRLGMLPELEPRHNNDIQARLITANIRGIDILSVYVPNGASLDSDKFLYKKRFLAALYQHITTTYQKNQPLIVAGDFNIAPYDNDIYDADVFKDSVLCDANVRKELSLLKAWGLHDLFHQHHPEGGHYSWWDYRALAFFKNHGLRIDLILASNPVAKQCSSASIDREERKGSKPSDHAPVIAYIDLPI